MFLLLIEECDNAIEVRDRKCSLNFLKGNQLRAPPHASFNGRTDFLSICWESGAKFYLLHTRYL